MFINHCEITKVQFFKNIYSIGVNMLFDLVLKKSKKSNNNQTMSEDMEEKKKLATFVKSVHKDLRKKFKNGKSKSE